jgi:hypothetical protein
MVIDTGTDRYAIQAPGATMHDTPFLSRDLVTLATAHTIRREGTDWMLPEYFGPGFVDELRTRISPYS